VLVVPLCCGADGAVVPVVGALPTLTLNVRVPREENTVGSVKQEWDKILHANLSSSSSINRTSSQAQNLINNVDHQAQTMGNAMHKWWKSPSPNGKDLSYRMTGPY
jgi:hypothetical protein